MPLPAVIFLSCPCMHAYRYVRPCMIIILIYKPLAEISPNLQLWCSWGQRWTDYILRSKGQRSRLHWDHAWSDQPIGMHFLTCPQNAWTYFNETCHIYLLPGPDDNNDIFKVMGSKAKARQRNLMNARDPKRLKGFEPKLVEILPTLRSWTG